MLPQPLASGGDEAYAIRSQNAGVHANLGWLGMGRRKYFGILVDR